jgi:energy-coupling factor transporter ATP-binding protein EcfA2
VTNAIEVRGLRKSFGRTVALDGLDLTVRTGEVHAFLGPNGAGKTTTIRILLGLLRKDAGRAAKRKDALIERFALDPAKKARAYSKGNRQKAALTRECIDDERRGGRTVLLSSHILAEAEALSDRVTIIRDGRSSCTARSAWPGGCSGRRCSAGPSATRSPSPPRGRRRRASASCSAPAPPSSASSPGSAARAPSPTPTWPPRRLADRPGPAEYPWQGRGRRGCDDRQPGVGARQRQDPERKSCPGAALAAGQRTRGAGPHRGVVRRKKILTATEP